MARANSRSLSSRLSATYDHRFQKDQLKSKERIWSVLCSAFFSQYVDPADTVLDVGAGHCEFINQIACGRRIAVDANPRLPEFAAAAVETHVTSAYDLEFLQDGSVDFAFASNFLEHLPDKSSIDALVAAVFRVLRQGGVFCVMGPNIKHVRGAYWDYYDHHVPLTDQSVVELLSISGFSIERCYDKFLPYTVKSRLPTHPRLVGLYLALGPFSFKLLGKQFLVLGRKARCHRTVAE